MVTRYILFLLVVVLRDAGFAASNEVDLFAPFTTWEKSKEPNCSTFNGCLSTKDREIYLDPSAKHIPCGFMVPSDLDKVRTYFQQNNVCKIIVYTAVFNAYDFVYNPIAHKENFLEKNASICFILFIDENTLLDGRALEYLRPGQSNQGRQRSLINGNNTWKIILIKNLFFKTAAHTMKLIKLSAPMLFPNSEYMIYVDTKYIFSCNPETMVSYFEKKSNGSYSIGAYAKFADSVEEGFRGAKKRVYYQSRVRGDDTQWKGEVREINAQYELYKSEGLFEVYTKRNTTNLIDSAILIIKNDNRAKRFFCAWLNEVTMFSRRDQLAFHMVQLRLQIFTLQIWKHVMMSMKNHFVSDRRFQKEHLPKLPWNMYNDSHPHPFKLHPSTSTEYT